jgi:uncharacterized membrane protein
MQRIILIYGTIAGVIELAFLGLSMGLVADHGSLGMVLGYLSMLIAMSLVFVGVKKYRDDQLGGVIRFWKAFLVGLGIAGIACLFYAIGWEIYLAVSGSDFIAEYMASAIKDKAASGVSPTELAAFKAEMAAMAEMYANPLLRFLITLSEIAPVALLVPLISAMVLRNPRALPARV